MSDTAQSYVKLVYNGTDATDTFKPMLESFSFTDNANGAADTITVTANNQDGKWFKKKWVPQETDWMKAWIGVKNWQSGKAKQELYCGKFQLDTFTMSGYPQIIQLQGLAIPINTGFNVTSKNRTWEKTDTKRILQDIAKDAGVSLVYDAEVYDVAELSPTGTDMNAAYSLCNEYGLSMKTYNNKLVVYDPTRYEKKDAVYTIHKDDLSSEGGYSYTSSVTTLYDSVKMQYGSSSSNVMTYEFTRPKKEGNRTLYVSGKVDSIADAEIKAKAQLRSNIRNAQTIMLQVMGETKYKAAECFKLKGFGALDGKYFVDSVTHTKAWGKYEVSINAHRCVTDF